MASLASVALVPLVGPFHTRWPRYTVVHVREAVKAVAPDVVALAPLAPGALADPAWQDTDEVALPHTVVPWARAAGVAVTEVGLRPGEALDPGDVSASQDLQRFLGQYEAGQARLAQVRASEAPVRRLLESALDLRRVGTELLPAIREHQAERERLLGAGPGTEWLEERAAVTATRALGSGGRRIALLAAVDQVPVLEELLDGRARLVEVPDVDAGEEGRQRALLDVAMRGDAADVDSLLASLADLPQPEARYHEANLHLAAERQEEALASLQRLLRLDFVEPYFLPGFALARLGQVYDLVERRADALKAYRGVLALSYAPAAAVAAATAGLEEPFSLYAPADG